MSTEILLSKENIKKIGIALFLKIRSASVLKQFKIDQWEKFDAPTKDATIKFWKRCGHSCQKTPMNLVRIFGRS